MICTKCAIDKPIEEFRKTNDRKSGYRQPCKVCHRAYCKIITAKWRAANPEKNRAIYKKSRQKNHEKIILGMKRWRTENPEKVKSYKKIYNAEHQNEIRAATVQRWKTHRERDAACNKRNYDANPEPRRARSRAWTKSHTIENQIRTSKSNARKRSLPDTFTNDERQYMMQYFGYSCAACGRQEGFQWILALDHWIPLTNPECPGTVATNIIPLCHGIGGCNNSKKNKNAHEWLIEHFGKRKANRILKNILTYFELVQSRKTS